MSFERSQHAPPVYWEEFEDLCRSLFAKIWNDPQTQRNGRSGEEQHGVDIWGRLPGGGWGGIQCKGKDNRVYKRALTMTEVRTEVTKALAFKPPLKEWTIVTSGSKNGKVELLARQITEDHRKRGLFDVHVMGWEDLLSLIGEHDSVVERYFPNVARYACRTSDMLDAIYAKFVDPTIVGGRVRLADLLGSAIKTPKQLKEFDLLEAERLRRVLGAKSATLLRWPTMTAGEWLDRPELGRILEHLAAPTPPPLVLLGPLGSGKSALMARLGSELAARGTTLLALKADALPPRMNSLAELAVELEMPGGVDESLARLSLDRPVVLLIDQLDALADLMDQHGGRLGALLSLVALVRNTPNLSVILSSREFEFRNDARLTTIDAMAIHLSLPPWKVVQPILMARGFKPAMWHKDFQEVLRSPQHLDLFLSHLADDGGTATYGSYHDMLEEVFRRRILSGEKAKEDGEALYAVARAMVEEEDLWVASARFDAHTDAIRRLQRTGFLTRDGSRIGFRHQTLFDFVRARAFLANGESVASYALARQGTIFARPTVWSALSYLRASNPTTYARELRRMWLADVLRPHMRRLLQNFIGQQAQPSDEEARLLLPFFGGGDAVHILRALSGSVGWFDRLLGRMADLMGAPDPVGWACAWFLRTVLHVRRDTILSLISAHWMEEAYHQRAYLVLNGLSDWTDGVADIADRIAVSLNNWNLIELAEAASKTVPHRVPGIVLRKLEALLATAHSQPSPTEAFGRFLGGSGGFHGLGKVLLCMPERSVRTLWSWYVTVAEETVSSSLHLGKYKRDYGGLMERFSTRQHAEDLLGPAFGNAIAAWAGKSPDAFLDFASSVSSTDLEVLHLLLAEGLKAIVTQRPAAVLDYLLEDDRRLRLGSMQDGSGVTKVLIGTLSPLLAPNDLRRLIDRILQTTSGFDLSAYEPKERLQVLRWIRLEQMDLLMEIPAGCRMPSLTRHICEEVRALGEPIKRRRILISRGSNIRMTATSMAKAKDRDVLRFLGFHPDQSGWGDPLDRRRGRSVDASRVFGEFAKEHPDRARQIISRIPPGDLERPVGYAISAMAEKGSLPPDEIVALVMSLHERGYSSTELRHAASFALVRMAEALEGLDDQVCEMLVSWLSDWVPPEKVSSREDEARNKKEENLTSLFWGHGGHQILPDGNYPTLRALERGLMLRKPPAANSWLSILEEHLGRAENPKVWETLADDLRFLWHADRERTITFLYRLFDAKPSIVQEIAGLQLFAWIHRWLPDEMVHRYIQGLIEGDWDRGFQAAGEFAGLRVLLVPGDSMASSLIEQEMARTTEGGDVSDFLHGVACTMAEVWMDGVLRASATGWIERMTTIADRKIASAISPIFHAAQGKLWDDATERVLRACASYPVLLTADTHFLPQLLKEVLRDGLDPVLVGQMAIGMIRGVGAATRSSDSTWVRSASDFFEKSTVLQSTAGAGRGGIELFEELLGAELHSVGDQLNQIDRNRFA